MKGANNTYWGNIREGITSLWVGLLIGMKHIRKAVRQRKPYGVSDPNYFKEQTGLFTLQYPAEAIPLPDNARYRLYNEIEDCIVCDLCAKVCPVDCIEIEAVKSPQEIGKTSDGTTKRLYAAKFDIDMAKCCYCGLCTTVCPTECLTMTKTYDYSEFDITNMNYHFSEMSPEEADQKRKEYETHQEAQKLAKATAAKEVAVESKPKPVPGKVVIPGAKPVIKKPESTDTNQDAGVKPSAPKPIIKPVIKPIIPKKQDPTKE